MVHASNFASRTRRLFVNRCLPFVALLTLSVVANAVDFSVEFDVGPVGGVNGNVVRSHLSKSNWTTVGHRRGSNLSNYTGGTIVAIWMKVPDNGSHQFLSTATGGNAFATVWRKRDGSELLFLDGSIPAGSIFWNRVRPRYLSSSSPLIGQAYHSGGNIPAPDEGEWERLTEEGSLQASKQEFTWQRLEHRLALTVPEIKCYTPVPDAPIITFLSNRGFPFAYDARTDRLHPLEVDRIWPADVNHLEVNLDDDGELTVEIYRGGTVVAKGKCKLDVADAPTSKEKPNSISRVYFCGPNVFDLETGDFKFTLFDFPAALVFRVRGTFDKKDDIWYYFDSPGFQPNETIKWRFSVEPAKAFDGHRVQRKDNSQWRDLGHRVYMTLPWPH